MGIIDLMRVYSVFFWEWLRNFDLCRVIRFFFLWGVFCGFWEVFEDLFGSRDGRVSYEIEMI